MMIMLIGTLLQGERLVQQIGMPAVLMEFTW